MINEHIYHQFSKYDYVLKKELNKVIKYFFCYISIFHFFHHWFWNFGLRIFSVIKKKKKKKKSMTRNTTLG